MNYKMNNQKGFIGIVALVIIGFIGLAVVGSALNLITIPWLKFNSQVQMNRDIVTKTYNADNAIYNYHWFQERAGAIDALRVNISTAHQMVLSFEESAGLRKDWTFEDKTEDSRLRSVEFGLKAQYENLVKEYNARANEADRTMFVEGLPLFFSLQPY